jgi:hypothetical protein
VELFSGGFHNRYFDMSAIRLYVGICAYNPNRGASQRLLLLYRIVWFYWKSDASVSSVFITTELFVAKIYAAALLRDQDQLTELRERAVGIPEEDSCQNYYRMFGQVGPSLLWSILDSVFNMFYARVST